MEKKIMYSAVQPSGNLTIGNYVGTIRNWTRYQEEYDCFFAMADMHAITVRQDPADLRRRTLELAALYLAGSIPTSAPFTCNRAFRSTPNCAGC